MRIIDRKTINRDCGGLLSWAPQLVALLVIAAICVVHTRLACSASLSSSRLATLICAKGCTAHTRRNHEDVLPVFRARPDCDRNVTVCPLRSEWTPGTHDPHHTCHSMWHTCCERVLWSSLTILSFHYYVCVRLDRSKYYTYRIIWWLCMSSGLYGNNVTPHLELVRTLVHSVHGCNMNPMHLRISNWMYRIRRYDWTWV